MIHEQDDFPLSPDCWADGAEFYKAFLKAEDFLSKVPARSRSANPDRTLYELTSHMYSRGEEPQALFRARLGAPETLAAVWLTKVRTLAEWFTAAEGLPEFSSIDPNELQAISHLSVNPLQLKDVGRRLFERGILLVHEPHIAGMKVDGAVFKLATGNPVIGLSLRFPRVDHYWFTLMHELAHVVLHSDQLWTPILDDIETEPTELIERQADKLASDSLIPRNLWRSCPAKYSLAEKDVFEFAEKLNIAPQIVAGRLRREARRHDIFSDLVNQVNVREILFGTS